MAVKTTGLKTGKRRKKYDSAGRLISPGLIKKPVSRVKKKPAPQSVNMPTHKPGAQKLKPVGPKPKSSTQSKPKPRPKPTPAKKPNPKIKPKKGGFGGYVAKYPDLAKAFKKHKDAGGKGTAASWGKSHYEKHGKKEKRKLS